MIGCLLSSQHPPPPPDTGTSTTPHHESLRVDRAEFVFLKRPSFLPRKLYTPETDGLSPSDYGAPLLSTPSGSPPVDPGTTVTPAPPPSPAGFTLQALRAELAQGRLESAVDLLAGLPVGVYVDSTSLSLLLKRCGQLKSAFQGRKVHEHIERSRDLRHETFLGNHLIDMYRRCGQLQLALSVFEGLFNKNVYSWTIMISTYTEHGLHVNALQLFQKMQEENIRPDKFTVTTVLGACAAALALELGREIHGKIKNGQLESDIFVESNLVNLYAKCGNLEEARIVFEKMRSRNVVAWTAMISGYAQRNQGRESLLLFKRMLSEGVKPDPYTLAGVVSAGSNLRCLRSGQDIHAAVVQQGFESNVTLGNAMIHMYANCGSWESSWNMFCKMHVKDVISWTAMFDAYTMHGRTKDTLQLFEEMQWEGVIPDKVTYLSLLAACGDLLAYEQGRKIHAAVMSRKLHTDEMVGSALIHMYGKCGSVQSAREVFDNIYDHNVHTWTAIITVYSHHGHGRTALLLFDQMLQSDVKPNEITFVSVLSACSHAGLTVEGWRHFHSIGKDYGMNPTAEHYACMVDLLCRTGFLEEAEDFVQKLPIQPTIVVWRTMLCACIVCNDIERGKRAAEKCILLEPTYGAPYVLLSSIYGSLGQWEEVSRVKKLMIENGARRQLGRSAIEVKDKMHEFLVDDKVHPRISDIQIELDKLYRQMEETGFTLVPNVVLHDVEEETDMSLIKYHSEILAIVFGYMMTPPGTVLRVQKNLRVCTCCHATIKHISKMLDREIIVKDSHQFHHFDGGTCSCKDYW